MTSILNTEGSGFDDMEDDEPLGYGRAPAPVVVLYKEPCKKCRGSGRWTSYSGSTGGACFECGGKGFHEFKTSPEYRTTQREKAAAKKVKDLEAKKAKFIEDNLAVYEWLLGKRDTFDFAASLLSGFDQYGSLTPGQVAAAQRLLKDEPARLARIAAQKAEREAAAPEVKVDKVKLAFDKAAASGLRYPKLRLDGFTFSPAGASSRNVGSVYVKMGGEEDAYLGKIAAGRFFAARDCTPEAQEKIVAACDDPEGAAIRYGRLYGCCSACGRKLTDPVSVANGIGPICATNFGW